MAESTLASCQYPSPGSKSDELQVSAPLGEMLTTEGACTSFEHSGKGVDTILGD